MVKTVRISAVVGEWYQDRGSRRGWVQGGGGEPSNQERRREDPKTHFAHFLLVSSQSRAVACFSSGDDGWQVVTHSMPQSPLCHGPAWCCLGRLGTVVPSQEGSLPPHSAVLSGKCH